MLSIGLSMRHGGANTLLKAEERTAIPNPWLAEHRRRLLEALQNDAQSNNDLRKEVRKAKEAFEALREELKIDDEMRQRSIKRLEERVAEEQAKVNELTASLKITKAKADAAAAQLEELKLRLADETSKVEELNRNIAILRQEKASADATSSAKIEQLDAKITAMTSELEKADLDAKQIEEGIQKEESALAQAEEQLKRQMEERGMVVRELQNWSSELAAETDALTKVREAAAKIPEFVGPVLGERPVSADV